MPHYSRSSVSLRGESGLGVLLTAAGIVDTFIGYGDVCPLFNALSSFPSLHEVTKTRIVTLLFASVRSQFLPFSPVLKECVSWQSCQFISVGVRDPYGRSTSELFPFAAGMGFCK